MTAISIIVELRVDAIEAGARLWRALGFELAFAYGARGQLPNEALDRATFARFDAPTANPISVFLSTQKGTKGTSVHLMLATPADVDAAAARLRDDEFEFEQQPRDQPWGMRDFVVLDGDGHRVVIGASIRPS